MGFLIKKTVQQIVTAKITLSSADLLTPGYIIDIPEYPAVINKFWQVIYMNGNVVFPNFPAIGYLGTSQIHIQAQSANIQYRFNNTLMQTVFADWVSATVSTVINQQFNENRGLQIHNPGTLTLGNSYLDIYIGATLIQK
jgi:hypothetical protein